jgi:hypothetical protein
LACHPKLAEGQRLACHPKLAEGERRMVGGTGLEPVTAGV